METMIEGLYAKYLACGCRVTTDSRTVRGGELFFALRGEKLCEAILTNCRQLKISVRQNGDFLLFSTKQNEQN